MNWRISRLLYGIGNVLVVVSNFVNGVGVDNDEIADNYEAIVKSASAYYPPDPYRGWLDNA